MSADGKNEATGPRAPDHPRGAGGAADPASAAKPHAPGRTGGERKVSEAGGYEDAAGSRMPDNAKGGYGAG